MDVTPSFLRQGAMTLIGAKLTSVEPGKVVIEVPYRDDLSQQDGFFHAGIMTTAVDSAGGYAAYSMMPGGSRVLSTELKVNFLRPARGDVAICTGEVVKPGKTLFTVRLDVHVRRDGELHHAVTGLQTVMCLAPE